jgi:hypothetical protein
MEPRKVCISVVADTVPMHHFYKEQDPDPQQREKSDPQSSKSDPRDPDSDPHHSVSDLQYCL